MMMNNPQQAERDIDDVLPRPLIGFAVLCVVCAMISLVHAESLPDPTRPPGNIFVRSAGTGMAREAAENSSAGLRTIIISANRRAAIIDGKTVELGGQYGNARLVEVNVGSVVLQRGKNRYVLTLFPGVKITRAELPSTGSAKMESSNHETQVEQPSPASEGESSKHELKPAAQDEKLLSGHPKEKK